MVFRMKDKNARKNIFLRRQRTLPEKSGRQQEQGKKTIGIDEATAQLIQEILQSDTYREYKRQCAKVNAEPDLKVQIDEFRRKNFEMQMDPNCALDRIDQFEREYAGFREKPLVSDFLAAELAFCRMMQAMNLKITEAIQFE